MSALLLPRCVHCGDCIRVLAATGRPPRFCSDACRKAEHYQRAKPLSPVQLVPKGPFQVLVADPPWMLKDQPPKAGARKHYPLMTTAELCRFSLPEMTRPSWLFLWKLASMQAEALEVCEAWGFRPVQEIVWCKTTQTGAPRFGAGHYARPAHESCILAVKGSKDFTRIRKSASVPSWFIAPRSRHSEKPLAFYRLVERLAHGPYVEIFARRRRPGWACFGNELDETGFVAADCSGNAAPGSQGDRSIGVVEQLCGSR